MMVFDEVLLQFFWLNNSSASTDASRDAKSAAINLNNFGIFLTFKNICDNNLILE